MTATPTKAYLKGNNRGDLKPVLIRLSSADQSTLAAIRESYRAHLGFEVSSSIIISVALASLSKDVRRGQLPRHPSMNLSQPW